jgi:hypothetical protein
MYDAEMPTASLLQQQWGGPLRFAAADDILKGCLRAAPDPSFSTTPLWDVVSDNQTLECKQVLTPSVIDASRSCSHDGSTEMHSIKRCTGEHLDRTCL